MSKKIEKHLIFAYIKDIYPDTVQEHKILDNRKFKSDYYIPSKKTMIEYEGLFSKISRHTTITGYHKDCEKYTLASLEGYKIIRITAMNTWDDLKLYLDKL